MFEGAEKWVPLGQGGELDMQTPETSWGDLKKKVSNEIRKRLPALSQAQ